MTQADGIDLSRSVAMCGEAAEPGTNWQKHHIDGYYMVNDGWLKKKHG
jgi:hypothetical protein